MKKIENQFWKLTIDDFQYCSAYNVIKFMHEHIKKSYFDTTKDINDPLLSILHEFAVFDEINFIFVVKFWG